MTCASSPPPDTPGIIRSVSTTSKRDSASSSIARLPTAASSTAKPSSRNVSAVICRSRSLSSTTSTEACVMIVSVYYCARREGESQSGPGSVRVRPDIDCAAMGLDDRLRQKQPETDSVALGGEERLEDVARNAGFDSAASVRKTDRHRSVRIDASKSNSHLAPFRHRLYRVRDHVDETSSQLLRVHLENRRRLVAFLDQLDSLALHFRFRQCHDLIHQLMHVCRCREYFDRPPVMQKALHQIGQPPHLIFHDPELM